jgi:hypothetical protein
MGSLRASRISLPISVLLSMHKETEGKYSPDLRDKKTGHSRHTSESSCLLIVLLCLFCAFSGIASAQAGFLVSNGPRCGIVNSIATDFSGNPHVPSHWRLDRFICHQVQGDSDCPKPYQRNQ